MKQDPTATTLTFLIDSTAQLNFAQALQRSMLAMALISGPRLPIADEPTAPYATQNFIEYTGLFTLKTLKGMVDAMPKRNNAISRQCPALLSLTQDSTWQPYGNLRSKSFADKSARTTA